MHRGLRSLSRGALIAALYAALTIILAPISFGAVQLRVSEALTVLPMLLPEAVPGLGIGCFLANLFGGATVIDTVAGSLTTLLAAYLTRRLRGRRPLAMLCPVLLNGVIVGPVVYFCYLMGEGAFSLPALLLCSGSVALGEAIAVYGAGTLIMRIPQKR